ncbi:AAA family ATPase [Actinomycetes bacterium KLBMP 9797]
MTGLRDPGADVVVLTALSLEYDAVHAHLVEPREHVDADGTRYALGVVRGGACRVALAVIGAGNAAAAALTGRAIEEFRPRALLLVGVAGGLADDLALGDVVVATHVYAYQGGRAEPERFRPRPRGWPLAHRLEQIARGVARTGTWAGRVHFKPLVSGDVVLDSRTGTVADLIAEVYGDAVAIDMESVGVAEAALRKDFYRAVTIRGVSDAAGGDKRRTDAAGWQPKAAAHAAAFAVALAERIVRPVPAPPPGRPSETGPCPYPGLAAFGERDADLFFGRGEVADELAALVARRRFVAVVGASGSGKSSLLRAGLLPRLRPRGWAVAELRPLPGVPAAKTLAAGLLPLLPAGTPAPPLPDLVGEVLAAAGAPRLLVCVDQFEELDPATAADLAGLLAQLATGVAPVHVVLTLRTETLDLAVGPLGLGDLARTSVFLLTPMRPDQLRAAVEAPAAPSGVTFEAGLVDRIVAAAGESPAALPLIQFALTRLWEEQDGPVLTHAVYSGFGGVEGALAGYAERVWSTELDDADRVSARRLFVQLTRPIGADGVVRRTARASELGADLLPVARRLAATRLVVESFDTADDEPRYDLAHAALATHWRRLRDWLTAERDFRAWQEDLRESVRRAEPLRGQRLTDARRWLRTHPDGVTAGERAFVAASLRRHRRRTAAWRGGTALVAVLAVLASTLAVVLGERSRELAEQVRRNAAAALVGAAGERAPYTPDTAALMTVAAYRASPDPAALAHLAGEYLRYRSVDRLLPSALTYLREVEVSADGTVAAAVGTGGGVLWRLDEPSPTPTYLDRGLTTLALSPDGRLVAGVDGAGQVTVRQPDGTVTPLGTRPELAPFGAPPLRFDARGRQLLTVLPGAGLRVWNVERRSAVTVPERARQQLASTDAQVWFGPDGGSLVVAGGGALTLWDLATGRDRRLTTVDPTRATVTRDGNTAHTCADGTLVTWNLRTRRERDRTPAPGGVCPRFSGSRLGGVRGALLGGEPTDHAGRVLLTGAPLEGNDTHLRSRMSLVDLQAGAAAYPVLPPNAGPVLAYDFAAAGDTIRVVSAAGSSLAVAELTRADFAPINRGPRPDFTSGPLLARERWAATFAERRLSIWDTGTGREAAHDPDAGGEELVRFTGDGRRLITRVKATHLVVREVPSLAARRLPLPAPPTSNPFQGHHGLCVDDTADPDVVAAVFAGTVSRFDLRSGARVDAVQLWRDAGDRTRLAGTGVCAVRRGGDHVAVNTDAGVEMWSLGTGDRVAVFPFDRPTAIAEVEFTPDGRHLAVLGADGTLDVWDVDRHDPVVEKLTVLPAGLLYPSIVDFPAADRIIVRIGGGIRIWDLARRAATANVDIDSVATEPAVSAHDRTLLVWMRSAGLMRMPLEPERWAEHLCGIVGRDLTDAERSTLPAGSPDGPICPHP